MEHPKTKCLYVDGWYRGKSTHQGGYWESQYRCPSCGRKGKFLRNYIGQRSVMCDGLRFTKEAAGASRP